MARRPAQSEERRKQILDAAFQVFAEQGFKGATNEKIAEKAGNVSPSLIYYYFDSKEDLFFAILEDRLSVGSFPLPIEQLTIFPPEQVLPMIAHFGLNRLDNQETINIFKIFASEAAHSERIRTIANKNINRLLEPLSTYLAAQMEQGRLRQEDPLLAAQTLLASLFVNIIRRQFLADPKLLTYTKEQIVNTIVSIFLRGMQPD